MYEFMVKKVNKLGPVLTIYKVCRMHVPILNEIVLSVTGNISQEIRWKQGAKNVNF